MNIILDVREIGDGIITASDLRHLSDLIIHACSQEKLKHDLSFSMKKEFEWTYHLLINYYLAGVLKQLTPPTNVQFISSSEWLCGIFSSRLPLDRNHLLVMMTFVNPKVSAEQVMKGDGKYKSGKRKWRHASPTIKALLDFLDDALTKNHKVTVRIPKIIILDEGITLSELAHRLANYEPHEAKTKFNIKWVL